MLVLSEEWDDAWVQVDGTCEVLDAVDRPEALDGFVEYFRNIAGEHSDWDEYRAAMVDAGQVAAADHPDPLGHRVHRRLPARGGPRPDARQPRFAPDVTMTGMQTTAREPAWKAAALLTGGFVAVLWVLEIFDAATGNPLDAYGVQPRTEDGLVGVARRADAALRLRPPGQQHRPGRWSSAS